MAWDAKEEWVKAKAKKDFEKKKIEFGVST
jgi:hypothetical protein